VSPSINSPSLLIFIFASLSFLGKPRGTIHDVLETYRGLIKKAKIVVNADVLPEEGAQLVGAEKADAISIGFNWITHPDLVKRVLHGKPLDNIPDIPHLQWGKDGKDLTVGYTDYKVAVY
jgi:2,4-dienoyl-CoA reductase-like NADH-dependent reductase (Old Yellow Enzyme family)